MRFLHKWQGAYNTTLNMLGNGMRCELAINYK